MLRPEHGLLVYSDGSYGRAGSPGGWSWVAVGRGKDHESDSGFVPPPTTNNRMEFQAQIEALRTLYSRYDECVIQIVTDSAYIQMGATDKSRLRNANHDLWHDLEEAAALHEHVEWRHIRGHTGVKYNEVADELAVAARKKARWT